MGGRNGAPRVHTSSHGFQRFVGLRNRFACSGKSWDDGHRRAPYKGRGLHSIGIGQRTGHS
jgi:hypothetical protein